MQIKFNRLSNSKTLSHHAIRNEENSFDIGPFVDEGSGHIYLPGDDLCMGPFWVQIKPEGLTSGTLMAFASSNLPLEGTCVSIDPEIMINF